jgi:selenocysteine lyase/cysteine desulfurase
LTPAPTTGPTVTFAMKGAGVRFGAALEKAGVKVTLGENHLRVSVSVYNDMEDVERLIGVLKG